MVIAHEIKDMLVRLPHAACYIQPDCSIMGSNQAFVFLTGIDTPANAACRIDTYLSIENSDGAVIPWESFFTLEEVAYEKHCIIRNTLKRDITASLCIIPFRDAAAATVSSDLLVIIKMGKDSVTRIVLPEMGCGDKPAHTHESGTGREDLISLIERQANQLVDVNKTLHQVQREINEELEMAKHVQISLMPERLPDFLNIKSGAVYMPASKVGGDFYDIILTPSQKLAILIYDVSGHGVPAALIGAIAKMLFAQYIEIGYSPAKVFEIVNKKMCEYIKTEHYLTAFLGIIDPIQNVMVYSRAGHVKPLIYNNMVNTVSILGGKGFFIGHAALSNIAFYSEETVDFSPNDKILFYTDGLTEGYNANNEMYGSERLTEIFKSHGHKEIGQLLNAIVQNQKDFCNGVPLRDDFTVLCMEIGDSEDLLVESGFTKEDAPNLLVVTSLLDIERVCAVILKLMDNHGFVDRDIKETKICIYEMCINAIDHGNNYDPRKRTLIVYKIFPDRIAISVTDQGAGFNYSELPDPCTRENLIKESGRGLFIIRNFMDEVHFNTKGNRILVVKYHRREM